MISGFRDFVLRGNVVDLAVAVVIGAAFTGLVTALTDNLVNPLVSAFGGGNVDGFAFRLIADSPKTTVDVGAILTAAVNFLIVAAVVYFLILAPLARLLELRKKGEVEEVAATPEDIALLQDIRDLLRERNGRA
jgi:large conductance mechanosensitive channel